MPEISPAESAPGESSSRLDPRTKLLALLVLNALVMRASPTTTLVAVQLLVVVALAWEVSARSALHTGFGCFICDLVTLGSPFLIAWMQSIGWPRSIVLIIGTCSAIMYWFARFFAGFGLALYVYRTTKIGQMKAALRAIHLPRVFIDALVVPLLSSMARVADDLAASSVVRGLGGSTRPTSLTLLRATVWDALALGCVAVVIVLEFFCYLGVLP